MISSSRVLLVSAVVLGGWVPEAVGQIRASERATVVQTVDGTVMTVEYSRPRTRGRASVFGDEVKWEEIWTPGANMATTLELSKPVEINGHPVPQGKYSVWIQVNQGDWIFMLDTVVNRFHTVRPKMDKVMLKFNFRPEEKSRMEVLTWWFPEVRSDRAVLAMQWDKYYVPLTIKVESSYSMAVPADIGRPMVGSYEMRWTGDPSAMKVDITYDRGSLWAHVDPAPFPGYDTMVLLRMKDDSYIPGWWINNELYDASDDMMMEFKIENGKATGFDVRSKNDNVIASGSRTR